MCTRSVRVQASLDCATGKPAEVDMHIKQAGWLAQPLGSAVWMPVAFSCICCFVAVGLVHSMGIFRSVPSVSCHRVLAMPYASLLHCLPSHRHDGTAYQHLRARCVQCRRIPVLCVHGGLATVCCAVVCQPRRSLSAHMQWRIAAVQSRPGCICICSPSYAR